MTKKLVSFRMPEDLMEDLRERAHAEAVSVTELVCKLLQQGLQTSTDDRITVLEREIQELRRANQPTPLYALLGQGIVSHQQSDLDLKERFTRLEQLVEQLVAHGNLNRFQSTSSPEEHLEQVVERVADQVKRMEKLFEQNGCDYPYGSEALDENRHLSSK